jgi:spore maturation protein CgeB
MKIAFFGSSLLSSYWNGAATYYRGIIRALTSRGHEITFYEPDAYDRQKHRDIEPPSWAKSVIYQPTEESALAEIEKARSGDLIIKASGVGVLDDFLDAAVLDLRSSRNLVAYWDVDAPATLERAHATRTDKFRALIPRYDLILTYGGGAPVVESYRQLGAHACVPIYNALDPETHHPAEVRREYVADLSFLGNRLPDREARVEEFLLQPACSRPDRSFLLAGNGWHDKSVPSNVRSLGHVFTADHNSFNCSARIILNINRDSMARFGFSPATRVFEAAGAGACLLTDYWDGIAHFFEPEREILVAQTGKEVAQILDRTSGEEAAEIGRHALHRALAEHTYAHRADQFEQIFEKGCLS